MKCSTSVIKTSAWLVVAAFCAFGTAYALPAPTSTGQARRADVANLPGSVSGLPGVTCARQGKGWHLQCTYGNFEIATYPDGCGARGFYGMVYATVSSAVVVQDGFPNGKVVAKLHDEQLVCAMAEARVTGHNDVVWYYLKAIPRDSVKACKGKSVCGPEKLPVDWAVPAPAAPCHAGADGNYTGACATGWVKAENFSEFSNGL